jgi:hypothetical protein
MMVELIATTQYTIVAVRPCLIFMLDLRVSY